MSEVQQSQQTEKVTFGFWLYLMTDCVLFASLFAVFAVMRNSVWDGPAGADIFSLPYVWLLTMVLLLSSFTCGLALIAARNNNVRKTFRLLVVTGVLGLTFLGLELYEFAKLVHEGYGWQRSGFLSAFFTLVGMHGLHISAGLIWLGYLLSKLRTKGLTAINRKRLHMFSMFWHFLDVIWIFIFTIVYLMGVSAL